MYESGEMYLETILILSKSLEHVRSVDVGRQMGFSKPSVSRAMGLLKQGEYINIDGAGFITLTDEGRDIAEKIYERHTVLSKLLGSLGVSAETADNDACKIEHIISEETFRAIKQYIKQNDI